MSITPPRPDSLKQKHSVQSFCRNVKTNHCFLYQCPGLAGHQTINKSFLNTCWHTATATLWAPPLNYHTFININGLLVTLLATATQVCLESLTAAKLPAIYELFIIMIKWNGWCRVNSQPCKQPHSGNSTVAWMYTHLLLKHGCNVRYPLHNHLVLSHVHYRHLDFSLKLYHSNSTVLCIQHVQQPLHLWITPGHFLFWPVNTSAMQKHVFTPNVLPRDQCTYASCPSGRPCTAL